MMYAPGPRVARRGPAPAYYEELKNQLRPVVNKAIWVFEKNLETARKLGYDSEFVAQTEAKFSELQAVLLAGDTTLGRPTPASPPRPAPSAPVAGAAGGEPSPRRPQALRPRADPAL
jgi:hypothetical protein